VSYNDGCSCFRLARRDGAQLSAEDGNALSASPMEPATDAKTSEQVGDAGRKRGRDEGDEEEMYKKRSRVDEDDTGDNTIAEPAAQTEESGDGADPSTNPGTLGHLL